MDWQRREAKLIEEGEERDRREAERRERVRRLEEKREAMKSEMKERIEGGEALLVGVARAQLGESGPWRT